MKNILFIGAIVSALALTGCTVKPNEDTFESQHKESDNAAIDITFDYKVSTDSAIVTYDIVLKTEAANKTVTCDKFEEKLKTQKFLKDTSFENHVSITYSSGKAVTCPVFYQ